MAANFIYVPELNAVFDTVSAAAKAAGADASNVRKVLSGKRKSAGGYHFIPHETLPGGNIDISPIKEARSRRRVSASKKKLIGVVHDQLKDINQRYKNAKREGTLANDPVLQALISHADYFGMTKTGLYDISPANLRNFSEAELTNLLNTISNEKTRYYEDEYNADKEAFKRSLSSYALQLGLSSDEQMKDYTGILTSMFDLFKLARQYDELQYYDMRESIYTAAQEGAPADKILEFINAAQDALEGNRIEDMLDLVQEFDDPNSEFWEEVEQ